MLEIATQLSEFRKLFQRTYHSVNARFVTEIIKQAIEEPQDHAEDKPKRVICLQRRNRCIAAVVLLPKRGGAVKSLLLTSTKHEKSFRELLDKASGIAGKLGGRKMYFLHPVRDSDVVQILRRDGFQSEGLLRAPYSSGQDVIVLSKFI